MAKLEDLTPNASIRGVLPDGVHATDVSDLMRRMVKESLLKFDGTPLFPPRIAYTVPYRLSGGEAQLYRAVTDYVREEFDRAEALSYNALVQSWPEIVRLANQSGSASPAQAELL
ncbi:MAG: hypothetical protein IT508_02080 [Burkholderiaceae bacterium]|nr:hypothetical protein [Burkholderiaceae bacterium]